MVSLTTNYTFITFLLSVLPFILTAPNLLSIQIGFKQEMRKNGSCATLYMLQVTYSSIAGFYLIIECALLQSRNSYSYIFLQIINQSIFSLNMWLYSFILKLVPCVVLTILTACLIRALYKVRRKKHTILAIRIPFSQVDENSQKIRIGSNSEISALRQNSRSKSTDKTTKLLAVILILFLAAEFPQVIV